MDVFNHLRASAGAVGFPQFGSGRFLICREEERLIAGDQVEYYESLKSGVISLTIFVPAAVPSLFHSFFE